MGIWRSLYRGILSRYSSEYCYNHVQEDYKSQESLKTVNGWLLKGVELKGKDIRIKKECEPVKQAHQRVPEDLVLVHGVDDVWRNSLF